MIYSIGYQGMSPQALLAVLDALKVEALIDVRSVPSSRKPGYSRKALQAALGARYEWRGDSLGGRGDGPTVDGLAALELEDRAVMLLCLERLPGECHRYHAIALPLADRKIEVWHVVGDEVIETLQVKRALASEAAGKGCTYDCAGLADFAASLG
jgi:uncharacterized protein (DUF488 family)